MQPRQPGRRRGPPPGRKGLRGAAPACPGASGPAPPFHPRYLSRFHMKQKHMPTHCSCSPLPDHSFCHTATLHKQLPVSLPPFPRSNPSLLLRVAGYRPCSICHTCICCMRQLCKLRNPPEHAGRRGCAGRQSLHAAGRHAQPLQLREGMRSSRRRRLAVAGPWPCSRRLTWRPWPQSSAAPHPSN